VFEGFQNPRGFCQIIQYEKEWGYFFKKKEWDTKKEWERKSVERTSQ
jgi:hypothetical protein